ncbi:hypothetical protein M413DRAFT_33144 [Hebeloma cylindrosporum]|uniref:Uncharacterized protein n=1 Tax=Hebeloma cylindrosporum TaxID=76867 RepID=A0A0C3BCU7_HEBCY|nr:hypothetical protein M413DRAFT_33144 [Hebeloma cylindrosporum h7]
MNSVMGMAVVPGSVIRLVLVEEGYWYHSVSPEFVLALIVPGICSAFSTLLGYLSPESYPQWRLTVILVSGFRSACAVLTNEARVLHGIICYLYSSEYTNTRNLTNSNIGGHIGKSFLRIHDLPHSAFITQKFMSQRSVNLLHSSDAIPEESGEQQFSTPIHSAPQE